ncbi:MAG: biosynthetic-type acetolactate synthase large subunit [Ectothiorhodospiraceae bacterium]|nr:biosynthetic-type acetolactate synthase large subunit [Ectothiorhodospiraceae bacterium]
MNQTGAGALVRGLLAQGTEVLFGYPGGAIMPVYDALYDVRGRLRHVLVRHEQGAAHAAQGYARATGRVGVCIATSGPGATNFITGLADALMDSTPLLCITGQVRSDLLGRDAFQEADVVGMSLAATKWSRQVTSADEVADAVAEAFEVARTGRPGPVLLELTRDAQAGSVQAPRARGGRPAGCAPREDLSGLAAAAALIDRAERPLLVLGHGVLISGAVDEVRALAERTGMPVACTLLGLSAFPTDHPQYVGMVGMHGNYAPNKLTNAADVIVAIGMRFDDRVTGRLEDYARGAKVIHVEIDPAEVNRHVPAEVALVGDARRVVAELLPRLAPAEHPAWLGRFRALERAERAQVIDDETRPVGGPLRMGQVVDRLSALTDGRAIVVSDVGQHQMAAARYYRFREADSHITSGGLGTMGFALPAAVGAKLGRAGREVVAVIGDGGFQMSVQELATVAQEGLAVKIVVLNNEHLGMVRQWQELFFDGRLSEVTMRNPDFVALAAAYGIPGERVDDPCELDDALRRLLASPGPMLLEVRVGRTDNVFPMIPAGASVDEIRLS